MLRCAFALLVFALCRLAAAEVHVYAAASLTQVLREIGTNYSKASGDKFIFNFGASSLLARQIDQGAPADIFFSADDEKMDHLQQRNLIAAETRKTPLSNLLVIVAAKQSRIKINSPRDLTNKAVTRLALAQPTTVPAGIYAKRYLEKIGLWPSVVQKVIPTENVRGALSAVESGNADAAIVYQTDAASSDKVRVVYRVRETETPDISYPVAVLKSASDRGRARRALGYLLSPDALEVFQKHGFIIRDRP